MPYLGTLANFVEVCVIEQCYEIFPLLNYGQILCSLKSTLLKYAGEVVFVRIACLWLP